LDQSIGIDGLALEWAWQTFLKVGVANFLFKWAWQTFFLRVGVANLEWAWQVFLVRVGVANFFRVGVAKVCGRFVAVKKGVANFFGSIDRY